MPNFILRRTLMCATLVAGLTGVAFAAPLSASSPLVQGPVSDAVTVPLAGDRPGALKASFDEGLLAGAAVLPHVRLELKRPAASQAALDKLTHDQTVRGSASYRHWLTPAQLRAYGPAQADINKVVTWLIGHGLTVNSVSPSGMSIDFGGRAASVATAFHTQLHNVAFAGEAHISNVAAPAIPAALAPVVTGVTLANFFPKPQVRPATPNYTKSTSFGTFYAVTPSDFSTIYNINPLRGTFNFFSHAITGAGTTVAVVEQTVIRADDWKTFRSTFGLGGYHGTLTQIHPGGCASPGTTGDEIEAAIDAEWSSAVAPDAAILEASCASAAPLEFGVEQSLENLIEVGTPATVFSISYGGDEIANGFAFQVGWANLLEEGAAEGKAIFVSSGDQGVSADRGSIAVDGLFVNGLADTQYNVSVGGTDFYDTALGQNAKYWKPSNSVTGGSAISYIPEIPWDNACSNSIIWMFYKASGAIAFCNTSLGSGTNAITQNGVGGSGSQSDFYPKPSWQSTSIRGVPNDGVRDQPDVSLFAANGFWSHFYLECMSDTKEGGVPCNYSNQNDFLGSAYGGTSFGAPAFAGIQALVQQTANLAGVTSALGNPAPAYYGIAQAQFATPLGFTNCNSTLGNKIGTACAFNYVTAGDNTEPCYAGSANCITSAASTEKIGVLGAVVGGKSEFAYPAQPGYSLATGLGTVNVTNLLYNYPF